MQVGAIRIEALQGDITTLHVDAVVNAANEYLKHGGGVAAAIVRAGGHSIQDESDRWVDEHGPVARGQAAVTGAGRLPARWVVHTVGPRYEDGQDNESLLREAVAAALDAAAGAGAGSVALPAVSAGIFGYPRSDATAVIASEVIAWSEANPEAFDEIVLVGFDEGTAKDFRAGLTAASKP